MKIAVSGANGFLGSSLVMHLQEKGYSVIGLARGSKQHFVKQADINIIQVDYHDPTSLASAISAADIFIHNAGKTRTNTFKEMYEANVGLTSRILEQVNQSPKISHFIYISSQAASRPSYRNELVSETDPPLPVSWYGKSKLYAELCVKNTCKKPWTIIRPCPVFGPGDRDFLALFQMLSKGISLQSGRQDTQVNMIYVNDLCSFIESCLFNRKAYKEIFFASDGQAYFQDDIFAAISEAVGKNPFKMHIPKGLMFMFGSLADITGKVSGIPQLINSQKLKELNAGSWLCSIEKAGSQLHWKPEPDFKAKIGITYKWYKEMGWL